MQNSMPVFNFLCFRLEIPFLGQFSPKSQNRQFIYSYILSYVFKIFPIYLSHITKTYKYTAETFFLIVNTKIHIGF